MGKVININARRTMSGEEIEEMAMKYMDEIVKKNASFTDLAHVGITLIESAFVIQAQGGILKKIALQDIDGFFKEISQGIKETYDKYYVKGGVQKNEAKRS